MKTLSVSMLLVLFELLGQAEPVSTIFSNGDPSNRLDIAVLGDGYTQAELPKYADDVMQFVLRVFLQEPYKEYQQYINVHRIDVVSTESGADHPERMSPVFKNTALDSTYNCFGIQRLICVNSTKVLNILSASLPPNQRDIILVIVNDPEYGGSGGDIAVSSTNTDGTEIVLHELGHTLGLLADEYGGPAPPVCDASVEPPEPNVTKATTRDTIKWNHWIDNTTPIPTTGTSPGLPGLYEQAKYCDTGLYRPTYNSKMRSLGLPFEQINSEQQVKRYYNYVSPIDSASPSEIDIDLPKGQTREFSVSTPKPLTHDLKISWLLDGSVKGAGEFFLLDSSTLDEGIHILDLIVKDETPFVRNDLGQLLVESRMWTVDVKIPSSGLQIINNKVNLVVQSTSSNPDLGTRWARRHLYDYRRSNEQKHTGYSGTYRGDREDVDQWQ